MKYFTMKELSMKIPLKKGVVSIKVELFSSMNTIFCFTIVAILVGWKLSWLKLTFTPFDLSSYKFLKWKHQRFTFYSVNKIRNFSMLGRHIMYRLTNVTGNNFVKKSSRKKYMKLRWLCLECQCQKNQQNEKKKQFFIFIQIYQTS